MLIRSEPYSGSAGLGRMWVYFHIDGATVGKLRSILYGIPQY